jgi:hypothetical protein
MSRSLFALIAIAAMVPASLWCSLRTAAASDLTVLPVSCRRRLLWWQRNAHYVYLGSGCLVALVALVQVIQVGLLS